MKNNRIVKLCALLLVAVMALLSLPACTSYKKGDTTVFMTVGGVEVTAEQYRFICMKNATILAGEDQNYFEGEEGKAHLAELEEAVERELRLYYAVETLAKKYEVKLSSDDKDLIKEELKALRKECESKQEYYDWLESSFMSENVFYIQTSNYYLERNLFYHLIDEKNGILRMSDEQLMKDVAEHFYAAGQILIKNDANNPENILETVMTALENGADFYELAQTHSGDTIKDVRYFTKGEMQDYFEEAVKALEIGQISAPIESEMGVHIIKREAIDENYVKKNLDAFRDTNLVRIYNEMLEEEAQNLEIVYTDAYTGLIRQ